MRSFFPGIREYMGRIITLWQKFNCIILQSSNHDFGIGVNALGSDFLYANVIWLLAKFSVFHLHGSAHTQNFCKYICVEVALAGYSKDMIEVIVEEKTLTIKSADLMAEKDPNDGLVHKGIAMRAFNRSFTLADDVVVKDASLKNGLLKVELERVVPEEKKPKVIKIK